MRSLDQLRAGRAYAAIAAGTKEDAERARGLPAMLQQNGLLAVWAFHLADNDRRRLIVELLAHFRGRESLRPLAEDSSPEAAFLTWVGSADRPGLTGRQLRDLTAEALAVAGWLKRAAEARLSGGQGGSGGVEHA